VKVFVVLILGGATSILIHGNWLFIDNSKWTNILINSSVLDFVATNYHDGWGLALISGWFMVPLLLPISMLAAIIVNNLNYTRLYIYTVLTISFFQFGILPKLPVFDVILSGMDTYMNVIYKRITPLVLFLTLFYLASLIVKKYNKQ